MGQGFTRRALLRLTGGAAVASIAVACGGGATTATPAPATAEAATPSATAAPTAVPPAPTPRPSPTVALLRGCAVLADDPARPPFIDTHTHLDGITASGTDYPAAAETALAAFAAPGVRTGIVMPMPFNTTERAFDVAELAPVVERCRQRLAFGGGGGTLQPMIATAPAQVNADLRRRFTDTADAIVKAGAVVFGEMAALHLSFNASHPFEEIPADHPLFLLLAEIAARARIPIDLHIDAVTRDSPTPPPLRQLSPNNPATLKENIRGFERLLAHARDATVVWAHSGADQTGQSTPALYKRLMQAHPNLVLQLKIGATTVPGRSLFVQNDVLDGDRLRPEWLDVIRSFPDRIVLGGDNFHSAPSARTPFQRPQDNGPRARVLLQQLPADLARKVASENALRIYRLA